MRTKSLGSTKVWRAGATKTRWQNETSNCDFQVNKKTGELEFYFSIASKGGGITEIKLAVGEEDLPKLLNDISDAHSKNLKTKYALVKDT